MTTLENIYATINNGTDFAATILDSFVEYIEANYIGRSNVGARSFYLIHHIEKDDSIEISLKIIFNEIILEMYKNGVEDTDGLYERLYLGPDFTYLESYKFIKKFKVENVLTKEQYNLLDSISSWYKVAERLPESEELY